MSMRVQIDDVDLFVDVEGAKLVPDGPVMREKQTLLLLHGGPGFDHSAFKPEFSKLTDIAQIIYFDQRGQGRSGRSSPDKWNLAQWADDVVAVCDTLGIDNPAVLGLSFGGMVAQAYATRHREHPCKLILMSTAARVRLDRAMPVFERLGGKEARRIAEAFWEDPREDAMQAYLKTCLPLYTQQPQDRDALARVILNTDVLFHFAGKAGEFSRFNFLPELKHVACPTLVLAGEEDPITPIEDAEDLVSALPPEQVRFERFANCGHGVHRDDPEQTFRILREFLAS